MNKTGKMAWARDALARAELTQRDLARVWSTSESSVSRWLDGFQASDLPLGRAVLFANLVHMNLDELATRLGHPPDVLSEEQHPVTPANTPPIPTVTMNPGHNGRWHLLLHLELSVPAMVKIVAALGGDGTELADHLGQKP